VIITFDPARNNHNTKKEHDMNELERLERQLDALEEQIRQASFNQAAAQRLQELQQQNAGASPTSDFARARSQPTQPTTTELEDQLGSNARELQELYKNPPQHRARIRQLEDAQEALFAQRGQTLSNVKANEEAVRLAQNGPELSALDADISAILTRLERLYKFPDAHRAEIRELEKGLDVRDARKAAIEGGAVEKQWVGDE
jgi:hypothetical protein